MKHFQKDLVRDYFEKNTDLWNSIYDKKDLLPLIIQKREEYVMQFIKSLNLPENSNILDIGCGAGLTCKKLLENKFCVVGIDASPNMIQIAKKNCNLDEFNNKYHFKTDDAENLDFQSNKFDVVVAMGLVEYLDSDIQSLREMYRVLKPGGYLLVTFPNRVALSNLLDPKQLLLILKEILINLFKKEPLGGVRFKNKKDMFRHHFYYPIEVNRMLKNVNFEIIKFMSHNFGPFRIFNLFKGFSFKINQWLENYRKARKRTILNYLGQNIIVFCKKNKQPPII